ncbi:RDD family protein [Corynebacterium ciconiae DSM 44920]|uniref:RDD family protein n=1 Tax=Corynebacterium ciconiae TaxID=227319 RepID=UPI0003635565|nr:RDD family protein [Corynebacterium ciconiae]WKD60735.1 RDD family protein [Corynebacterium ciconiae DSM 44920]
MAEKKRSWLDGPAIPSSADGAHRPSAWPGEKLGLPESGPGALASVMRRSVGVLIDWVICWGTAIIIDQYSDFFTGAATLTWLCFFVLGTLSVAFLARTPGQALLGIGVGRIDEQTQVGLWRAAVRTALTLLIFPAAMVDEDGRGIHDRVTQTAVIFG